MANTFSFYLSHKSVNTFLINNDVVGITINSVVTNPYIYEWQLKIVSPSFWFADFNLSKWLFTVISYLFLSLTVFFVLLQPFKLWCVNKVYNYFLHLSSMIGVAFPFCISHLFLFRNKERKTKYSNCKMEIMLMWHFPHLVSLLCYCSCIPLWIKLQ